MPKPKNRSLKVNGFKYSGATGPTAICPMHFSFEWDSCQRIHPRANSAGQLVRSPSPDSDDDDDDVHGEVHLPRLATSDLRNLELR